MTTFANQEQALVFAQEVISQKWARCCNVLPPLTSVYNWKGDTHRDPEILVMGKTTKAQFQKIKAAMGTIHPYDVPELIGWPIADGYQPYLDWLEE